MLWLASCPFLGLLLWGKPTNCQVVRTLSEPSRRSPPWWDLDSSQDSSLPTRCNLEADPVAPAEPQMTVALAANLTATL